MNRCFCLIACKGISISAQMLIFCAIFCPEGLAKYSGGTGEPNSPYQIANVADLLTLAGDVNDYNDCFIMTADIDLDPCLPGGEVFSTAVIAPDQNNLGNLIFDGVPFTGVFDGGEHRISNLTIDANGAGNDYLGLFGRIDPDGEVENLSFEDVIVTGGNSSRYLGGLSGYNSSGGGISNCHLTGSVTGASGTYDIGGLVGHNSGSIDNCFFGGNISCGGGSLNFGGLVGSNGGFISDCHSAGIVTGAENSHTFGGFVGICWGSIIDCYSTSAVNGGNGCGGIGGLVGDNSNGIIRSCRYMGTVTSGNSSFSIGGLVGGYWKSYNNNSVISDCYSTGTVTGQDDSDFVGGLVGSNKSGDINNCFSTSDVTATYNVGGLAGCNQESGDIRNCYASGDVTGSLGSNRLGGLVGLNQTSGNIHNCYSVGDVNGTSGVGGLVGVNVSFISNSYFLDVAGPNNGFGIPLTDAQMKQQSSFVGWDFVWEAVNGPNDIWAICEDVSYPKLAWQYIIGDSDNDKNVDFEDFSLVALKWQQTDSTLYCGGTDLTGDEWVDLNDLDIFAENWLRE